MESNCDSIRERLPDALRGAFEFAGDGRSIAIDFVGINAGDGPGGARTRLQRRVLSGLCDAATGVRVGCSVLAAKLDEAARELARTSAAAAVANGPTAGKSSLCIPACRTATIGCVTISPSQAAQKRSDGISVGQPVAADDAAVALDTVTRRALQLWNGGGNPDYSRQVIARIPRYR